MKFVIEGLGLTSGGGKASMVRFLPSLAKQTAHEFVVLLPDLPEYSTTRAPNLKVILRPKHGNLLARHWYLNHTVPKICRQEDADALLCMGNFGPSRPPVPTVLFVRNAYHAYHEPVAYNRATLREKAIIRWARTYYRRLHSQVTVAVQTEVMKRRMASLYHVDSARIVVIPDAEALPATSRKQERHRERTAPAPFTFLCLAVYAPHKNQEILLDAMKRLPAYSSRPVRTLITIAPHQHPGARKLLERIKREKLENFVTNTGLVSGAELEQAYMSADAAIQPTLLESFGRVYSESMSFDLPLLTSDRDFAHQVCQDAAVYFDPLDADSVARAMASVMEDENLRSRLVERGGHILQKMPTWDCVVAQFVDVMEHTAKGQSPVMKGSMATQPNDVRTLFNHKAHGWRSKYGPNGKLHSRVEQFTARLSEVCPPPSNILDLGCGTGEIAEALEQRGYTATACDFAEEMIEAARSSHPGSAVEWVRLEPDWEVFPFADSSFDGIVASSIFEYLVDVPRVATELSRVLRPEGVLLLTVPNPCNFVRKLEAWLQRMPLVQQLSSALRRVQRIDSYAAYLRLSRNRFEGQGWQSLLSASHFTPLDERDFSQQAWRRQARAPLVLLAVKRVAMRGNGQFDADEALCRPLAI